MKKTLISIAALFFSISIFAQQSEQLFEIIDNNGNDKIEKNEFDNYISSFENDWDNNNDNLIDKDEFERVYLAIVNTQHQNNMKDKECDHAPGEPCKHHKEMGHENKKHSGQDKIADHTFTHDKTSGRMDPVYEDPYNYAETFYDTIYNTEDWHVSDNTDANYDENAMSKNKDKMHKDKMHKDKVALHSQKAFNYWDKDNDKQVSQEEIAAHLFQMMDDNNNTWIDESEFNEYAPLFLEQTAMN